MGTQPALELDAVRVVRGRREVLRDVSLTVEDGETVAVLGPNGAGKSTLLLTAALLLEPSSGRLRLFGEDPGGHSDRTRLRRRTSTVFQDAALLDMSARRNLEVALGMHGVPRGERRAEAERWLERLGVGHLAEARPHTLSGGEAQRVSLARAFAVRPRLIFMDEPFSALDPESRAALVGDLRGLLQEERAAALIATHDLSEAQLLADRAAVMLDGRAAQIGPVDEVFARPAGAAVAAFLGYSVVPAAVLRRFLPEGTEPAAAEGVVPPRAARLATDDEDGAEVTVLAVQGALGQARLVVDAGAPLAVETAIEEIRARDLRPGTSVRIRVDPARVFWL